MYVASLLQWVRRATYARAGGVWRPPAGECLSAAHECVKSAPRAFYVRDGLHGLVCTYIDSWFVNCCTFATDLCEYRASSQWLDGFLIANIVTVLLYLALPNSRHSKTVWRTAGRRGRVYCDRLNAQLKFIRRVFRGDKAPHFPNRSLHTVDCIRVLHFSWQRRE